MSYLLHLQMSGMDVEPFVFFLGAHKARWLWGTWITDDIPLFISARTLRNERPRSIPRGYREWAIDSGGFTELAMYGRWQTEPQQYADEVRAWAAQQVGLRFAAVQDWMCEPIMLHGGSMGGTARAVGTGMTIEEHQRRTIGSLHELRRIAPEMPWLPVLQGWRIADYEAHVEMYARDGVDLREEPVVGLGSVCRRHDTDEVEEIVDALSTEGIRLHIFGSKGDSVPRLRSRVASADSMAWSYAARMERRAMCGGTHASCANCPRYAERWWREIMARGEAPAQRRLFAS